MSKHESFLKLPEGDYQVEAWLVDDTHICVSAGLLPRIIGGVSGQTVGKLKPFLFSKTLKDSRHTANTSLDQLIVDGWARSLPVEQTLVEANKHGFLVRAELVKLVYEAMDNRYHKSLK
jgi:hypothetical protein